MVEKQHIFMKNLVNLIFSFTVSISSFAIIRQIPKMLSYSGEMSEWLKEHAWKACVR